MFAKIGEYIETFGRYGHDAARDWFIHSMPKSLRDEDEMTRAFDSAWNRM